MVGTCRHFAVLSCALLRYSGIPAADVVLRPISNLGRASTTGSPSTGTTTGRDRHASNSEIVGKDVLSHPEDLQPGEFLSGGEAWSAYRQGEIDASKFGVYGTDNWGAGGDPR